MCEILFRGKRTDNGEWVEGDLLHYESGEMAICKGFSKYGYEATEIAGRYKVLPETVGQYTGLTDRNGKKIFEGDIVRECGGESCQGYYEIDNVLTVKIPDTLINFEMSYDCEYKIIGNIFDNPELMKGGNNNE